MKPGVFENWTPESVPCPRCRLILPSADSVCPSCGAASSDRPRPQPRGGSAGGGPDGVAVYGSASAIPSAWNPAPWAPDVESISTAPPSAPSTPVRRRRSSGTGRNLAAILALALIAVGGYEGYTHLGHSHSPRAAATMSFHPLNATPTTSSGGPIALSAILLQPSDLPGWTLVSNNSNTNATPDPSQIGACKGLRKGSPGGGPSAATGFSNGSYGIQSTAQSKPSQSAIAADVAMLRDPRLNACLHKIGSRVFAHSLPAGVQLESARFRIIPNENGTPANLVATLSGTFVLSEGNRILNLYLDLAFISGHHVESTVEFIGAGAPVDQALRDKLMRIVAQRAAHV